MQNNRLLPLRRLAIATALTLGFAAVVASAPAASAVAVPGPADGPKTLVTSQVVLERTGGLIGDASTFVVDADNTHPDAPHLFALTADADFLTLDRAYLPPIDCCDLFSYQVTVTYTVGTTRTVLTMDGATAPEVLWDVIGLTQGIGLGGVEAG